MELKVGDLVRHFTTSEYGIVVKAPYQWRSCMVCEVQWCFIDRKHLIDIDFLDKLSK